MLSPPNLIVGDIAVAMSSATDNAMTDNLAPGFRLSPCCDYYMLEKYMRVDPSMLDRWYQMIIFINQILTGLNH